MQQALDNFISASALDSELSQTDHNTASPLAGLGYGLPISRCYARHFGETDRQTALSMTALLSMTGLFCVFGTCMACCCD